MNRKTSIACAAIAAILVILFSQAYVTKIQQVNKSSKNKSYNNSNVNAYVNGYNTAGNNNQNYQTQTAAQTTAYIVQNTDTYSTQTATTAVESAEGYSSAITAESTVSDVQQQTDANQSGTATTRKKSILERANETTTQAVKKFKIINQN